MNTGDFVFFTLEEDTAVPPTTHIGEITAFDPGTGAITVHELQTGSLPAQDYDFQSTDDATAWDGQDAAGTACRAVTHDVYTAGAVDPSPGGVAVVTFGDGVRVLCQVDSVSPTTDVVCYESPFHRMSFDGMAVVQSDWDAYPVGDQAVTIEGYVAVAPATPSTTGSFADGWWSLAQRRPAFGARAGGPIQPFAVVVHTTDMVPESFDGLIQRWTTQVGDGACAHFVIGRDETAGVVQLVPITNNGNHAGGAQHGWFVAGQQQWHPNTVSVGIELHCAGGVRQVGTDWFLFENGAATGAAIPDSDVIPDPDRPGRGWHVVTDYQYDQLRALLDGLETELGALPEGCVANSVSQATPAWGTFATGRRVGHVSLDTYNRSDPWPPTCDWLHALP